jgi:hypothetical protein
MRLKGLFVWVGKGDENPPLFGWTQGGVCGVRDFTFGSCLFFFFFFLNEEENWRGREFALQMGTVDDGFPSTFTSTLLFLFTYFLFLNQTESKVSEKKSNELSKFEHRFGEF